MTLTTRDPSVGGRAERRPPRGRSRTATTLILILVLAALGGGVYAGLRATGTIGATPDPLCALNAQLVPECGVLVGVTTEKADAASLRTVESSVGGRFDLVYRFHDLDNPIPTPDERQMVQDGRTLHYSVDARRYTERADELVPWSEITGGAFDESLRAQARGIKGLGVPVYVTFEHEADAPTKDRQGTPAEFHAAWRHVRDLYAAEGVDNAVWVWVVTGIAEQFERAGQLYPGDDVVDWVSWDVYNPSGCRVGKQALDRLTTFEEHVDAFTSWMDGPGRAFGIGADKPLMLSEVGSVVYPNQPGTTAAWYAAIPDVLERNPRIRSVTFWDHTGNADCDYRFNALPGVARAVGSVLQAPAVTRQR